MVGLKSLFGFAFFLFLAMLILRPTEKLSVAEVGTIKEFGTFLEMHAIVPKKNDPQVRVVLSKQGDTNTTSPNSLKPEDKKWVDEAVEAWSKKEFVRDQTFRNQMENLLDIAEKNQSLEVLDTVRSQMIAASYDSDEQIAAQSKSWMDRYLKLETRENFQQQIKELHP